MLNKQATPQMIEEWKLLFDQYKDKLKPNRKTGQELVDYLLSKYSLTLVLDYDAKQVITLNVLKNEPIKEKLPQGLKPNPVIFCYNDDGNIIYIGIDLSSGYYCVEGNSMLWDELCAFQGLDYKDLENYYCVAQYITCLKKFNQLDLVLES